MKNTCPKECPTCGAAWKSYNKTIGTAQCTDGHRWYESGEKHDE